MLLMLLSPIRKIQLILISLFQTTQNCPLIYKFLPLFPEGDIFQWASKYQVKLNMLWQYVWLTEPSLFLLLLLIIFLIFWHCYGEI